jgi:hypothetical protein
VLRLHATKTNKPSLTTGLRGMLINISVIYSILEAVHYLYSSAKNFAQERPRRFTVVSCTNGLVAIWPLTIACAIMTLDMFQTCVMSIPKLDIFYLAIMQAKHAKVFNILMAITLSRSIRTMQ